ncbi:DUF5344 family protein [Bacillus sp. FSL W7-1360]
MEIQVNVEEANQLLQSVGELAMSFQAVAVENSADDLDTMSEVGEIKSKLDTTLEAFMSALYLAEAELQALIQGYETTDKDLRTQIETQANTYAGSFGSSASSGGAPFAEQPAQSGSPGGSPFAEQPAQTQQDFTKPPSLDDVLSGQNNS